VIATFSDGRKKPSLLVVFEETDTAGTLLLAPEFRQAVNIAHLLRLAQQFAERRHLAIDGGVAVAALTKGADQVVELILREGTEARALQDFIYFAQKRPHIIFMRTVFPKDINIPVSQLSNG